MITSREYGQFAHECTKWAVETDTAEARRSFLALAKDWTFAALVADRVEKRETTRKGGPPRAAAFRLVFRNAKM